MSESTVDRDPFEVVAASFLARYRAGERPSIEEYAAKYPELADQIRALLPALVMVEEDLSIDRGSRTGREQPPTQTGHVLETLAQSIGSMPRLVLSDTDPNETGATATVPASGAMHVPVERGGRYELFGEIARGGMGAVLKGRDPDLGRDLAVKVLLESASRTSPTSSAASSRRRRSAASCSIPASCRSTSWAPSPTAGPISP